MAWNADRCSWRRAAGAVVSTLDRLLPPACASCGATVPPGPPLCGLCEGSLPEIPRPRCRRCGGPCTSPDDDGSCALCDPWPASLRGAASAVLHAPPADALVAGLKYRGWTALVPVLATAMVEPARRLVRLSGRDVRPRGFPASPAVPSLAPVPLDRSRARRRGFNQATLLAAELSRLTGWPVRDRGLARRRANRRQAELGRAERLANVLAAYYWEPGIPAAGRPVVLVDDVLTTGATAAACAAAIEAAGGRCLGVVTFARSLPRPEAGRDAGG